MSTKKCPKCNGSTEDGFIADTAGIIAKTSKWIEGKPEKSNFTVTKTMGKKQLQISTYRCQDCGYLESYAS